MFWILWCKNWIDFVFDFVFEVDDDFYCVVRGDVVGVSDVECYFNVWVMICCFCYVFELFIVEL